MSQYIIADEAVQDLDDISEYLLNNDLEAGKQFLKAFNAIVPSLLQCLTPPDLSEEALYLWD